MVTVCSVIHQPQLNDGWLTAGWWIFQFLTPDMHVCRQWDLEFIHYVERNIKSFTTVCSTRIMKKYTMEHTVVPLRKLVICMWAVGLMQHCLTYTLKMIAATCMHWRTCQFHVSNWGSPHTSEQIATRIYSNHLCNQECQMWCLINILS